MRHINRIAALALLCSIGMTSAACSTTFTNAWGAFTRASEATIDPKYIVISANIALGMQSTAKNYLRLKRCNGANGPICRDPGATPEIGRAVLALRKARKAATSFTIAHPAQLGPTGLYEGLQLAIATATDVFNRYNVTSATPPVIVSSGAIGVQPSLAPAPLLPLVAQ